MDAHTNSQKTHTGQSTTFSISQEISHYTLCRQVRPNLVEKDDLILLVLLIYLQYLSGMVLTARSFRYLWKMMGTKAFFGLKLAVF